MPPAMSVALVNADNMTIPNVTITWCQRTAKCAWCPDHINAGAPLVTVFWWSRGSPDHKGYNVKKYYHPNCWVAQGLDYLKMNPYVPYIRKKKLELSPEQSKQRYSILKRKAAIDQRKRGLEGRPDRVAAEALLNMKIAELMIEIASVGGIPKKWLRNG